MRIGSVVTPGGLHIHHAVFGIVAMVVVGILAFAIEPASPWREFMAFTFGSGAALTLDEFALVLHLEDVYWTGEGRKSIDAVILGLTFITLLLTGLLPASLGELGDVVTLSRWALSVLILSGATFVVVCYLKGKLFLGTVGIFVPPVAVIGALRLARPGSPWARLRYAGNPTTLERALRRDESLSPFLGPAQAPRVGRHRRQAAPAPAAPGGPARRARRTAPPGARRRSVGGGQARAHGRVAPAARAPRRLTAGACSWARGPAPGPAASRSGAPRRAPARR